MTAPDVVPSGFDFTDPAIYESHVPHDEFLALRQKAPVYWVDQTPEAAAGMLGEPGYWAVSRHADVVAVSKNSRDFSTMENGAIIRFAPDMTRDQVELQRVMLINQDPPDHTKTRQIISRGFTPRAIAALEEVLNDRARRSSRRRPRGEGDFVEDVAAELPLQAIADLLGVPQEDRDEALRLVQPDDRVRRPGVRHQPRRGRAMELIVYAMEMAAERKAEPARRHRHQAGRGRRRRAQALTDDEFGFFVIMLTVAGNETTRNSITHGMIAFLDNPDQWELCKSERPDATVDEIIRWATPVSVFQRTALHDVELGGRRSRRASGS